MSNWGVRASFYLRTKQDKQNQTKCYPINWGNFDHLECYENDEETEEEVIEPWDNFYDLECYENDDEETEGEVIDPWDNFSNPECYENDEETEEEVIEPWDNFSDLETKEEVIDPWDNFSDLECYENDEETKEEVIEAWDNFSDHECYENDEETEGEITEGIESEIERWINHYSNFQTILLVGEGDFSFSASLALAFGSASNMIATSLDSREFLSQNYGRAISNIDHLTSKGCTVMHGVDATEMAKNPRLKGMTFDRIIFNFPHAGFFKMKSREYQISKHQQLVRQFLKNAKKMIDETGEIHITHKTNNFHCEWNLELLALCEGLELIEDVHFNYTDYPGYRTKYGFGGDNNFNCNPSKTYKFRLWDVYKHVFLPSGWE